MKKNDQFRVDVMKYIIATVTCAVFVLLTIQAMIGHYWVTFIVLGGIAFLFAWVALLNGAVVQIDHVGLRTTFGSLVLRAYTWEEIEEIGIVGLKVFNGRNPQKTGTRYIYCSVKAFTEEERFGLALKWPPKKMIYLQYTPQRLAVIRQYWNRSIETYNAGDVFF